MFHAVASLPILVSILLSAQFDPEALGFKLLVYFAIPLLVLAILYRVAYTVVRYKLRQRRERSTHGGSRRGEWARRPEDDTPADRGSSRGRRPGNGSRGRRGR